MPKDRNGSTNPPARPVNINSYKDAWQDRLYYVQIPRPILTLDHYSTSKSSYSGQDLAENRRNEELMIYDDLSGTSSGTNSPTTTPERVETPTHFTLLGQSGVLHPSSGTSSGKKGDRQRGRSHCTSWQLSLAVCAFVLLALVAMIIYMEVYMSSSRS